VVLTELFQFSYFARFEVLVIGGISESELIGLVWASDTSDHIIFPLVMPAGRHLPQASAYAVACT